MLRKPTLISTTCASNDGREGHILLYISPFCMLLTEPSILHQDGSSSLTWGHFEQENNACPRNDWQKIGNMHRPMGKFHHDISGMGIRQISRPWVGYDAFWTSHSRMVKILMRAHGSRISTVPPVFPEYEGSAEAVRDTLKKPCVRGC